MTDLERYTPVVFARRFIDGYGHLFRWVADTDQFIVWDERRWAIDRKQAKIGRLARQFAEDQIRESEKVADAGEDNPFRSGALSLEYPTGRDAMLKMVRTFPETAVGWHELDAKHHLLNLPDGTLDLTRGTVRKHKPNDLLTKITNANGRGVVEKGTAWTKFLRRVVPDPEVRVYLQVLFGAALHGDQLEQVIAILVGSGGSVSPSSSKQSGERWASTPDRCLKLCCGHGRGPTPRSRRRCKGCGWRRCRRREKVSTFPRPG